MTGPGGRIITASWAGTLVFAIAAGISTIDPESLGAPVVIVSLVLFVAGAIAMFWAFLIAVARSTDEAIGIGGLYFGAGSAPARIRRHLMASLAVQLVIAFTAASIRIFTALAFGILVPVWGLGMAGLWCARHGTFAPRSG